MVAKNAEEGAAGSTGSEAGGTLRQWMRKGSSWELDDGRDIVTRVREHILASGGVHYTSREPDETAKERQPPPSEEKEKPSAKIEEDRAFSLAYFSCMPLEYFLISRYNMSFSFSAERTSRSLAMGTCRLGPIHEILSRGCALGVADEEPGTSEGFCRAFQKGRLDVRVGESWCQVLNSIAGTT